MTDQTNNFQILDSGAVSAVGSKFRQQLLASLAEPASAANLARRFDMSRQRVGYHMRELEKAGCIELTGERQQRGLTERLFQVRPMAYVFGPQQVADKQRSQDRFSWVTLLNLIAGALWDLVRLRKLADAADQRLATLAIDAQLKFASPSARKAFTEDLINAIDEVVSKHNQPETEQGRTFRLVLGAYPALSNEPDRRVNNDRIDTQH